MPPRDVLGELLRQLEGDAKKPRAAQRLEQQLHALLAALDHSQREHDRLRNRMSYLHSCLELLDKEQEVHLAQQLLRLQQRMGLHGSLGKQVPMLPDNSPLRIAPGLAERGAVSVHALPVPGCWDLAWDERVRALTPRDMFLLYKQYTQATAVMLPRAERAGPGSADYSSLQQLMDKYVAFAQHAISLAPGAWAHRTGYNFETLEPVQPPSREMFHDILSHVRSDQKDSTLQHCEQYAAIARKLRREYQELCVRYRALTGQAPHAFGMQGPSLAALQMQGMLQQQGGNVQMQGMLQQQGGNVQMQGMLQQQGGNVQMQGMLQRQGGNVQMQGKLQQQGGHTQRQGSVGQEMQGVLQQQGGSVQMQGMLQQQGFHTQRQESLLQGHVGDGQMQGACSTGTQTQSQGACRQGQQVQAQGPYRQAGQAQMQAVHGQAGQVQHNVYQQQQAAYSQGGHAQHQGVMPSSGMQLGSSMAASRNGMPSTKDSYATRGSDGSGTTGVTLGPGPVGLGAQLVGSPGSSGEGSGGPVGPAAGPPTLGAATAATAATGAGVGGAEGGAPHRLQQLSDVLRMMQANLWRQGMALKQVLYALWQAQRGDGCTDVARFYLLTYPVPLNIIDFLDILVSSPPTDSAQEGAAPPQSIPAL